ncbi:hypothetical protein [Levilactobacillus brevis]|uniref:hypothetical protein n=1 Tax=Levilactobacillus brevis TaxID=1580 RepID=UPI0031D9812C
MASNDEQRSATTIFTTAAQSIAARLIANKTTAKFTKAEISTTNLFNQSVTELQVLTSLDNVQQTADINTVTVINDSTVDVNIAIDQTKAPNDYQMNSVGLFAVDGDGKEVLYSVTVLKDPVYIHQDAMGSALGIDLETVVGQSSNVDLSINPAGAVTNEALKVTLADYVKTDDVKSLIPATVIDGSKPADFKESVTLEKGAVDGAGNVIATTKNLADGDAATLKSAKEYADAKVSGKADDSAVVHTADMRKPANQVASIEEVNAKQDKIGYTPADNSTVLHNNSLNRITTDDSGIIIGNEENFGLIKRSGSPAGIAIGSGKNFRFMATNDAVLSNNSSYHDVWNIAPTGKISILGGAYFTPADDSKVVHNSGNEEIGGQKTFDTAPIDKTTGNPYITKSGVPAVSSTLADTTKDANFTGKLQKSGIDVATKSDVTTAVSTATANMVHRNPDTGVVSEPTDFTNLTVNGGKSVATSDDLKSLEASAWHTLKLDSSNSEVYASGSMLYKIDTEKKILQVVFNGFASNKDLDKNLIFVNLSSLIDRITSLSLQYILNTSETSSILDYEINGAQITTTTSYKLHLRNSGDVMLSTPPDDGKLYVEIGYNELNEKENL